MTDDSLRRTVILILVATASLIAVVVIGTAIFWRLFSTNSVPEILENWGGLIIGFYFGTFATALVQWLGGGKSKKDDDDA